jgi:hypothetical protein
VQAIVLHRCAPFAARGADDKTNKFSSPNNGKRTAVRQEPISALMHFFTDNTMEETHAGIYSLGNSRDRRYWRLIPSVLPQVGFLQPSPVPAPAVNCARPLRPGLFLRAVRPSMRVVSHRSDGHVFRTSR